MRFEIVGLFCWIIIVLSAPHIRDLNECRETFTRLFELLDLVSKNESFYGAFSCTTILLNRYYPHVPAAVCLRYGASKIISGYPNNHEKEILSEEQIFSIFNHFGDPQFQMVIQYCALKLDNCDLIHLCFRCMDFAIKIINGRRQEKISAPKDQARIAWDPFSFDK